MAHSMLTFLLISFTVLCGVDTESPISFYSHLRYVRQTCTTEQIGALEESLNASSCPNDIIGFAINQVFTGEISQEFVQSFCQPQCSDPVVEYYTTCVPDIGPGIAQLFTLLCSTNANGEKCYASTVIQAINAATIPCSEALEGSSCSSACREAAGRTVQVAECCVHLVDVPGTNFVGNISAACGIPAPDTCNSTGDITVTTATSTSPSSTSGMVSSTMVSTSPSSTSGMVSSTVVSTSPSSTSGTVSNTVVSKGLTAIPLILTVVAAVLMSIYILVELC